MSLSTSGPQGRREYLDWLRGGAVLLMIEAHLFDSWTSVASRGSAPFRMAMMVGGMGTTLFLMLAGVSVALSAGSKLRRSGDVGAASNAVAWRGFEIFCLAFVFRVQAWVLGWSHSATDLLKVDILNIMGPAIVASALLWRVGRSARQRLVLFGSATAATAFLTPAIRALRPGPLPDALEAYVVEVSGLSNFVFFPWLGLVFAGACAGVLLDAADTPPREARVNRQLALGGAGIVLGALAASYLPSPVANSHFWTTSPAYLFIRSGLVAVGIAGAYAWGRFAGGGWSPIVQLGTTSLFIYWIHVELIYGLISVPLHRALTLPQASAACVGFCGIMLGCSIAKERVVRHYRTRSSRARGPAQRTITAAKAPTRSPTSAE